MNKAELVAAVAEKTNFTKMRRLQSTHFLRV